MSLNFAFNSKLSDLVYDNLTSVLHLLQAWVFFLDLYIISPQSHFLHSDSHLSA
jgi:hypothetical protein